MQTLAVKPKLTQASPIPQRFFTREGIEVATFGDIWVLPLSYRQSRINFSRIENLNLKWAIQKVVIYQATHVSSHAGLVYWYDFSACVLSRAEKFGITENISAFQFEDRLIEIMEDAIHEARSKHRLWALYRTVQWYIWCSENFSEAGFSTAYASELEVIEIPGNPKGEAVREEDPDKGPLHRSLELPLLTKTLKEDQSQDYQHLQQKVAIALSIALGRNPANLTFLTEKDLQNLAAEGQEPCYVLKVPRIKKRQLNPRDDLMDKYLDPMLASHVIALIKASQKISLTVETDTDIHLVEKPLFISKSQNKYAIQNKRWDDAYNIMSIRIGELIQKFIKRHNIISPITGELMHVTPRRLRYTLATGLTVEGISKRELARVLDHTDTQHVSVYFEMAGNIVEHLDKATTKGFSKYLDFFKGTLVDSDEKAINGERDDKHLIFVDEHNPTDQSNIGVCGESSVCHLDPPYSCYLCPKFQPYRHTDHEHVLECLLADREMRLEKYEHARLGIQLDEVIAAVAQVAQICEEHRKND